ncbi:hypothetical protein GCM10009839_21680 [Catenulispora yoronensis]|uniref:Uncharacterized protein n=2 Tax=Catenulispora yoronensis TaxID=450799 RepID=A0ABN2TX89_9ACTN
MGSRYWAVGSLLVAGLVAGLVGTLLIRRTPPASASSYGCFGTEDGCSDLGSPQFTMQTVAGLVVGALLAGALFWLACLPSPTRPLVASAVVVLLVGVFYAGLLWAVPVRYGRMPDGPAWWPAALAVPVTFVLIGLMRKGAAPRTTQLLVPLVIATALVGVVRLHTVWHDDEVRTEIARLPAPAEVPTLAGWHVVDTFIGFDPAVPMENRSHLTVILATDDPPADAQHPNPATRWLVLTTAMETASDPQGPPAACTANCVSDGPGRWFSHADDRPNDFTVYVRRGTATTTISGLNHDTDVDTLRRAADSLRPTTADAIARTMRGHFP